MFIKSEFMLKLLITSDLVASLAAFPPVLSEEVYICQESLRSCETVCLFPPKLCQEAERCQDA